MAIMETQALPEENLVAQQAPVPFRIDVLVIEEPGGPLPILSVPAGEELPKGVSVTLERITIPHGAFRVSFALQGPWLYLDPALTLPSDQLARMGVAPDASQKVAVLGLDNNIPPGALRQSYSFNIWFQHENTGQTLIHDPTILYEPPGG